MPKKKQKSRKKTKNYLNRSILFYINILIIFVLVILLAFLTNKFILVDDKEQIDTYSIKQIQYNDTIDIIKTDHEKFEEKTKALEIEYINDNDNLVEIQNLTKPKHTFNFNNKQQIKKESPIIYKKTQQIKIDKTSQRVVEKKENIIKYKTPIIKKDTRPILAILIDDVTTSGQVRKIKNIGYPITMAFLPPTPSHKNSAKITKQLNTYMIHLPLEARTKRYEEVNTLHIQDSLNKIDTRIKYLKSIYPKAKYLNNHTGSKFTSNKEAMDKLMQILKKYNFIFVDSRTTSNTQAKEYAKRHNVKYLSRNIFLDNKQDRKYIQKQLKKAINIAKRKGVAIAIGHPHSITLKTLKESKYLLKGINLVYINTL